MDLTCVVDIIIIVELLNVKNDWDNYLVQLSHTWKRTKFL